MAEEGISRSDGFDHTHESRVHCACDGFKTRSGPNVWRALLLFDKIESNRVIMSRHIADKRRSCQL